LEEVISQAMFYEGDGPENIVKHLKAHRTHLRRGTEGLNAALTRL
jgi:hypothetical protein